MPDVVRWNDYARFTDEGWYGGAAIRHALTGSWYQPHGFNPAVALPLWPLLLRGWFLFTGMGMIASRALSVLLLGASLRLLYRLLLPYCGWPIASGVIILALLNPYTYAFGRMALLEPAVIFLMLLGITLSVRAGQWRGRVGSLFLLGVALGALMFAMVLVKTTAGVLTPGILYAAWASVREVKGATPCKRHEWLAPLVAVTLALLLWSAWFLFLVRPHYLLDFYHLFAINNTRARGAALFLAEAKAVYDGFWLGRIFYSMVLLALAASVGPLRRLWRMPVFVSIVLELVSYIGFLGWHAWRQQRYYMVCLSLGTGILAMALAALRQRSTESNGFNIAWLGSLAAIAVSALSFAVQTIPHILQPKWTFRDTAQQIAEAMRKDPRQRSVLLSIAGDDISLFTGVEAWNPLWPPDGLDLLLQTSRPGWYAAPEPVRDETIGALRHHYRLSEVARYAPMPDGSSHRSFVLYQLVPLSSERSTKH